MSTFYFDIGQLHVGTHVQRLPTLIYPYWTLLDAHVGLSTECLSTVYFDIGGHSDRVLYSGHLIYCHLSNVISPIASLGQSNSALSAAIGCIHSGQVIVQRIFSLLFYYWTLGIQTNLLSLIYVITYIASLGQSNSALSTANGCIYSRQVIVQRIFSLLFYYWTLDYSN